MFQSIEQAVKQLQLAQKGLEKVLDIAAIEAIILVFELLLDQEDELLADLSNEERAMVTRAVAEAKFEELGIDEKRQVLQLVLVGTIHEDGLQANYQLTPDAIGTWIAFVIEQFLKQSKNNKILDLGVGTGNLLATVSGLLNISHNHYIGIDNDDTLLTIASGMKELLAEKWELELKDVIVHETNEAADIVMADLPVGYYPAKVTQEFAMLHTADDDLTYVHHLMIEQGMKMLRPGGLGVFLVPANLFESKQAQDLLKYLQSDAAYFQALIKFPEKLFANSQVAKAILLLQKPGDAAAQATPVLLAKIPEVSDTNGIQQFVHELTNWMSDNQITKVK